MMGEFIIYYREKIVGGIYDDRLLVKAIPSAIAYMPDVLYELPYEGAKKMLLLKEVDDKAFITGLFNAIYDELPEPPRNKKKKNRIFIAAASALLPVLSKHEPAKLRQTAHR